MRLALVAAFLPLLLIPTIAAQADQDVVLQLQISKVRGQGGTIKGIYNGMAVEGTYSGSGTQGSWSLLANGVLMAAGTYACDDRACTFTGK